MDAPEKQKALAAYNAKVAAMRRLIENTPRRPLPRKGDVLRKPSVSPDQALSQWDFFLSHYQVAAGDTMRGLYAELRLAGKNVWYDKTEVPNKKGMLNGVANSAVFVLFLTRDVFTRPFCRLEIETALRLKKPILLLRETDDRLHFTVEEVAKVKTKDEDGNDIEIDHPEGKIIKVTKETVASIKDLIEEAKKFVTPEKFPLNELFEHCVVKDYRREAHETKAIIEMMSQPKSSQVVPYPPLKHSSS